MAAPANTTHAQAVALLDNTKQELEQVDELLRSDPYNAELREMRASLVELVSIYEKLVAEKAAAAHVAQPQLDMLAQQRLALGTQQQQALRAVAQAEATISATLRAPAALASASGGAAGAAAAAASSSSASSLSVAAPLAGSAAMLVRPSFVEVGGKVMAKYAGDGEYYPAVVRRVIAAERACVVQFLGYDDEEESVAIADLTPYSATQGQKRRLAVKLDESGRVVIPDNLKFAETDTPEQREAKKKKVHMLKSAARMQMITEKQSERKNTWQEFASKARKGVAKETIFRTPEGATGRVGVTGSGREMTQFNDSRQLTRSMAPKQSVWTPASNPAAE